MHRGTRRLFHVAMAMTAIAHSALAAPDSYRTQVPLGLPSFEAYGIDIPDAGKADLGRQLFFDKRLSRNGTVSCANCHDPDRAFTDGRNVSMGINGRKGTRNAPSLLNVAYQRELFWDGRAPDLETQARAPFLNPVEHGLASEQTLLALVNGDQVYAHNFRRHYPIEARGITMTELTDALASFERTLLAGNSPFDRYYFGGDKGALSAAAVRGLELFKGRAACSSCHTIEQDFALFTDQSYHPATFGMSASASGTLAESSRRITALAMAQDRRGLDLMITLDARAAAMGRFIVSSKPADIGRFRTPSLRNVAKTAPYMHDGSVRTLEQTVDAELYARGASLNYPIVLTAAEKTDLTAFLESLSSE